MSLFEVDFTENLDGRPCCRKAVPLFLSILGAFLSIKVFAWTLAVLGIYCLDLPSSSVITGMRRAKAGLSSPPRSPPHIFYMYVLYKVYLFPVKF